MTQYKITVNKDILHHLFSSNDEGMKELLKQILDQILEQQRTEQINAERYERTEECRGHRNGYKTRNLTTRVGTITLKIPQIRNGVFSTDLFKRYQRSEQALSKLRGKSAPLATVPCTTRLLSIINELFNLQ